MEHSNKYDRKGVYKITCTNCNKISTQDWKNTENTLYRQKENSEMWSSPRNKIDIEKTTTIMHLENGGEKMY